MTAMELNAELFRELSIKEIAEGKFESIAIDDLWK